MSSKANKGRHDGATDEALMLSVQANDLSALQELMNRHQKPLYNFLTRYTGDKHLGEDLFQDTFVRVMEKRVHFDPAKGFKPWLYAIAANLARDACRRREVRSRDLSDSVGARMPDSIPPDLEASAREEIRIVKKAIGELPGDARTIVLLHFYEGLRYREIADALAIPIGTVKSRMHWAVGRLAKAWSEGGANALVGLSGAVRKDSDSEY